MPWLLEVGGQVQGGRLYVRGEGLYMPQAVTKV
jgi:hypothetical protein